ncbi:alkaline phosphatase D family protein [Planotetraspora sp. A-T 1434]|uniref:alkaline phosphatase D family protein n=1 Tax=Planotetraspora sp. A-T 1434 TaxID=2979219 RepID=UPI0021C010E6|nr:alkaline phosphatase D family protein [Planotetraspora sp. A-T 1434]MCT9933400.1 alkaline phosphatase D family protein [Planotetraspora sp. A-T 1434]
MQTNASRRVFLSAVAAGAGGLLLSGSALPRRAPRQDPFALGIASGEPTSDGVVLWTRLALDPTAPDGLGGMPANSVEVDWQLASDEGFSEVVRSGTATARAAEAHSVHVEVGGLQPGREYFYRFRAGGHLSPAGRTRTAPAGLSPLTFVVAACAHWEHGYYTAYRRIAEQDPDLVVHLGDYIYEYEPQGYTALGGNVRTHAGNKCQSLADYRIRHGQYKTDPDLQAAHRAAPWLVAFDDHEIENNWAGPISSTDAPGFRERMAHAFQAYYENMPLRRASVPRGASIRINRRISWGSLAAFHLLDTRQFRDDQACDDGDRAGCDERLDAGRTILGADQRRWLLDGLAGSGARWNLIGQQVLMAQRDFRPGPGTELNMDSWDGYPADRARLLEGIKASGAANPVVLTGDAHMHHAADLRPDFGDPGSPRVAVELVTSSISSDGDGYRDEARIAEILRENPHISYIDQRRGYIVCRVSPEEMRAEFRTLDYISRRGAPAKTSACFTIPSGHAQLNA